jgi:hypothetical protein
VARHTYFRFNVPQTSLGLGFRYHTFVGPLRLDIAVAPDELQTIGPDERTRTEQDTETGTTVPFKESELFGIDGLNGAVSFTIGEAF